MIKTVDENNSAVALNFLGDDIISARLCSYIKAYGYDKNFVKHWICFNEDDVVAVLTLFESSLILKAVSNCDKDELNAFISMLSYSTLSCDEKTLSLLDALNADIKQGYRFVGNDEQHSCDNLDENNLKSAYNLICESIPGSFKNTKQARLSFLSDYTYRNRRGFARGKCITENSKLISCALTSAETETMALISGVATDSSCRKNGSGKKTVLSLAQELVNENKSVYVIALNNSAQGFYEHIGFKKCEKIAYIERNTDV